MKGGKKSGEGEKNSRRRMSADFYPTYRRGPPKRWYQYASRRARTPAATRGSPDVRAGRRSGTHTQSANFLSVHRRGSVVRAAARHGAHTNVAN